MGEFSGQRVTVMGLGGFGGGVGVARWLARRGARVRVTDAAPADKLRPALEALAGCDITFELGGHTEASFRDADLLVVNPAVPPRAPYLAVAAQAGVPLTTEINLFVQRCPAITVGITGSVGKSTVSAMTAHALTAASPHRVWLGGNIGVSLLDALPEMSAADIVVLELSSFQLERTPAARWSPRIALLTNLAPNHLDWHGDFASYTAAKLNLVRFQDPARDAIIICDTPGLREPIEQMYGDLAGVWRYRLEGDTPAAVCQSASAVEADDRSAAWPALRLDVPGRHNRLNAAAALTVVTALGLDTEMATHALAAFAGLPDRLQRVARREGITYYNDSKSTTPEAAQTAMDAMEAPFHIILGGYDKGADLRPLAADVARRAKFAACIGVTGTGLCGAIQAAGGSAVYSGTLVAALAACRARAAAGDVILLSPGCASWDQYADYRARGAEFTRLAQSADGRMVAAE